MFADTKSTLQFGENVINKLLYICSGSDNCIDECLMIAPADYVESEMLERAQDAGIEKPFIESVIEFDSGPFASLPSALRPYVG